MIEKFIDLDVTTQLIAIRKLSDKELVKLKDHIDTFDYKDNEKLEALRQHVIDDGFRRFYWRTRSTREDSQNHE